MEQGTKGKEQERVNLVTFNYNFFFRKPISDEQSAELRKLVANSSQKAERHFTFESERPTSIFGKSVSSPRDGNNPVSNPIPTEWRGCGGKKPPFSGFFPPGYYSSSVNLYDDDDEQCESESSGGEEGSNH